MKQVPDTNEIRIDPQTGNLIRDGVPSIVNPEDRHAVEAAMAFKEKYACGVTVISMGPAQAEEALRECLAMGADEGILLTDSAFGGADTWATSYTLGCAIQKIGSFDLILCGREALDGNTGQVGPQIAELLGIPQITYVQAVEVNGSTLRAKRAAEDGYEILEAELPALLTVTKDINVPRTPSIEDVMNSYSADIIIWTADDLPVDKSQTGIKGSPTRIKKAGTPELKRRHTEMINGTAEEAIAALVSRLSSRQLV